MFNKSENFWNRHQERTSDAYFNNYIYPNRYVFVLTNLCNLRCEFCFQARKKRPDAMETKDWLDLISQIPENSRITLTGGEPFVFKGFREVFNKTVENNYCNIISNGTLFKKETIEYVICKENLKVLSVSIDEIYSKNRGVTDLQWQRMIEGIDYFHQEKKKRKTDISLDVKAVIMDENAHQLFDLNKFAFEKLKADTVSYSFLKGSSIQHSDFEVNYDCIYKDYKAYKYKKFSLIKDQLKQIRDYNKQNKKFSFLHPNIFDINNSDGDIEIDYINNVEHDKKFYKPCMSPWGSVHVNVDGNIFPCMSISMGNVKNTRLEDILRGEMFTKFKTHIKKEKTVSACNRCGYLKPSI